MSFVNGILVMRRYTRKASCIFKDGMSYHTVKQLKGSRYGRKCKEKIIKEKIIKPIMTNFQMQKCSHEKKNIKSKKNFSKFFIQNDQSIKSKTANTANNLLYLCWEYSKLLVIK